MGNTPESEKTESDEKILKDAIEVSSPIPGDMLKVIGAGRASNPRQLYIGDRMLPEFSKWSHEKEGLLYEDEYTLKPGTVMQGLEIVRRGEKGPLGMTYFYGGAPTLDAYKLELTRGMLHAAVGRFWTAYPEDIHVGKDFEAIIEDIPGPWMYIVKTEPRPKGWMDRASLIFSNTVVYRLDGSAAINL